MFLTVKLPTFSLLLITIDASVLMLFIQWLPQGLRRYVVKYLREMELSYTSLRDRGSALFRI